VKTKIILSIKITADDEHVYDCEALPELVNDVIKSDIMATTTTGKLFADDGAYDDDNVIFRYLRDSGILPYIKVRKTVQVRLKKGNILRNLSVIPQKNDLQNWKDSESYGQRWIVETIFSCIKRSFRVCLFS
jgi:hypothetical protein